MNTKHRHTSRRSAPKKEQIGIVLDRLACEFQRPTEWPGKLKDLRTEAEALFIWLRLNRKDHGIPIPRATKGLRSPQAARVLRKLSDAFLKPAKKKRR